MGGTMARGRSGGGGFGSWRVFLDGPNVASLALMAVVTWQLARAAVVDWLTAGLAVASAAVLILTRVNSAWLVLADAVAGAVYGLRGWWSQGRGYGVIGQWCWAR